MESPDCEKCGMLVTYVKIVSPDNKPLVATISLQEPESAMSGAVVLGGLRIIADVEVCPNCSNIRFVAKKQG